MRPGFWRRHSKGRLSWSDDYQGGCLTEYYEVGTATELGLTLIWRKGRVGQQYIRVFFPLTLWRVVGSLKPPPDAIACINLASG